MKKLFLFIISIALIISTGCSDDSGGGTLTDPFGGGTSGTGNVTIAISAQLDQQGGGTFSATPSVAIKVTKITVGVPAQQYTESVTFDGTTVVNANVATPFLQYEAVSGIASGQQWTFQI